MSSIRSISRLNWTNLDSNTIISKTLQTSILNMYKKTYDSIGARDYTFQSLIQDYPKCYMLGNESNVNAVIFYWNNKYGNKLGLAMSDNDTKNKNELMNKIYELLKDPTENFYAEASHAVEHLINTKGKGVNQITNPNQLRKVIGDNIRIYGPENFSRANNHGRYPLQGSYGRNIPGLIGEIRKTLWGNPKIPNGGTKRIIKKNRTNKNKK